MSDFDAGWTFLGSLVELVYEQLDLFMTMTTRCGVKQGLWKCWPAKRDQNEMGGLQKRGRFKTF